jgi:hypothetical protein
MGKKKFRKKWTLKTLLSEIRKMDLDLREQKDVDRLIGFLSEKFPL